MATYDVIVVGAGNGGLAAAATAAKKGLKTLLIERHNLPGGAATSFTRGRFEFEPALHELSSYGPKTQPGNIRQLFDWLGLKVKLHPVPDVYRMINTGADHFDAKMPAGRQAFIDQMEHLVPGSRASVTAFFNIAGEGLLALRELQAAPEQIDWQALDQKYPHFLLYGTQPYQQVLATLGIPKKAQSIMMAYWCYMGIPGDEFEFAYFSTMLAAYVMLDAYVPENRSHELSTALVQVVLDHGGDAWFNTEVTALTVDQGRVTGVQIGDRKITAKQVICDIMPHMVYQKMLPATAVPKQALQLAHARQIGTSGFLVYFGLNRSPEELGIEDYSVFMADTADSRQQFAEMDNRTHNNFTIMNCLNKVLPECSPAGTSILYATKLYRDRAWDDVTVDQYEKVKTQVAQEVITQYEQATGVHIQDAIEEIEIAAPATFARYLRSPGGDIYGYYGQPWDQLLGRTAGFKAEDESIPGLHFCGGAGFLLDGYSSAYQSGYIAAKIVSDEIVKEGVTHG
ncbi:phytoene desaturase family protein [Loigolactobacillus bifermentans]|uniref:GDP dissociation inhibitor n=1 Tax=Loigolactobacillus bifermentans DSM 20003 TaxID=1423726 RepID=A0A0R1GGN9_9LACO|nr:FAD-dependent oxidoreductase [Loigolactobacillus bifermentans]KRK33326.1 GDP dissociation inhibitor [Loigolactobacillus bifermentans DSM 20003]QGG60828.1 FAD-binding protein [Loigolactobacillus bifermentans]